MKNFIKLWLPPIFIILFKKLFYKNKYKKYFKDKEYYNPLFQPWLVNAEFKNILNVISDLTVVSKDRLWILYNLAKHSNNIEGSFWECGVYKGGTSILFAEIIQNNNKLLRIFDTFNGMPETDLKYDFHLEGDFSNSSFQSIKKLFNKYKFVNLRKGLMPKTFKGLENEKIAFAHIDVDIYKSVLDCCKYIYPKVVCGGIIVFDDYGFPSCPGARLAVDSFFEDKCELPIILDTGQAIVIKSFLDKE